MPDALTAKAGEWFVALCSALAEHGIAVTAEAHDATKNYREADLATLNEIFYAAMERQARALSEQAKFNAKVKATLETLLADPQFHHVQRNYQFEAVREPMRERRRMLMFAQAGSLNVELTLGQIARVERTIRELDPEDVLLLGAFGDQLSKSGGIAAGYNEHPSYEALLAAGCVRFGPGSGGGTGPRDLTTLGRSMLSVMRGYLTASRGEDPHPPKR